MEQEVARTFINYLKYSYVFGLLMMYLILTPMISLIVYSLLLFIILTALLFVQLLIGWRVWRNGLDFQIHQRVIGFFIIFNFGIHGVMPFFFFSFGTIFFYISLAIYLLLLGFLFTKTKVIAEGIHNPGESYIGKGFLVVAVLIVFVAIPANMSPTEGIVLQLMDDRIEEFYVKSALYLLGLLLTFLLPVFFYPVQTKSEPHPTGKKKLSRAKRKALKAKKLRAKRNES